MEVVTYHARYRRQAIEFQIKSNVGIRSNSNGSQAVSKDAQKVDLTPMEIEKKGKLVNELPGMIGSSHAIRVGFHFQKTTQ